MPQERLSKIWDILSKGSRVLGWSHRDQDGKQTLTPLNGRSSWQRASTDARWQELSSI